jgi:hypothetical protein
MENFFILLALRWVGMRWKGWVGLSNDSLRRTTIDDLMLRARVWDVEQLFSHFISSFEFVQQVQKRGHDIFPTRYANTIDLIFSSNEPETILSIESVPPRWK